jgi:hypothetical protein
MIFLNSCHESLPLREDPKDILVANLKASYFAYLSDTTMTVNLDVENKFDETLQDSALLEGNLTIRWLTDSQYGKTIKLTKQNLQNNVKYNPSTGILTVDPGEVLHFTYIWNFTNDTGYYITQNFKTYLAPNCLLNGDKIFVARESFSIEGSMNVFTHTGFTVPGPITFSCCYSFGISKNCTRPQCE